MRGRASCCGWFTRLHSRRLGRSIVPRLICWLRYRKGVSFLSRFIGNKKKGAPEGTSDNGSDAGDSRRPEGMEAQLFRHTVDNFGFSPKYPQPPAYIKVRTRFKKEKQFDRMFLAQELRSSADKKSNPAVGANPAPQSGSAATQNPIWATEFSKDGKYLAAGGQDRIVRVWSVISTAEERRAQEKDESDLTTPGDQDSRLSAPVFQQKPVREYHGHTATILDLSWSKVCMGRPVAPQLTDLLTRITFCSLHQWTRRFACGI
jgi:hypothetical protein